MAVYNLADKQVQIFLRNMLSPFVYYLPKYME